MCERHKQSVNKLVNCWQQIELASILANFFANFFVFNQSKRALLTWFICEPTLFKFIEAVHNCPAVWNGSSLAYKDTNKNKQNKTEERADKLGFVQPFYFFSFLLFQCCTWMLLHFKTVTLQITVFVMWHEFDVWRKEFVNFSKFSNTSLPT